MFKFRNYDPETGAMRKHQRTEEEDTVEKQVEGLTEAAIAQEQATRNQELVSTIRPPGLCLLRGARSAARLRTSPASRPPIATVISLLTSLLASQDLTNIQPKKPNWDLKRDLERKLAKLKPKTDHAISTLIRTSLASLEPAVRRQPRGQAQVW